MASLPLLSGRVEVSEVVWAVPGRPTGSGDPASLGGGAGSAVRLRGGTFGGPETPLCSRPQGAAQGPARPGLLPSHRGQARQPLPAGLLDGQPGGSLRDQPRCLPHTKESSPSAGATAFLNAVSHCTVTVSTPQSWRGTASPSQVLRALNGSLSLLSGVFLDDSD